MAQPGWYPDSSGRMGHYRFWNGNAWSDVTPPRLPRRTCPRPTLDRRTFRRPTPLAGRAGRRTRHRAGPGPRPAADGPAADLAAGSRPRVHPAQRQRAHPQHSPARRQHPEYDEDAKADGAADQMDLLFASIGPS